MSTSILQASSTKMMIALHVMIIDTTEPAHQILRGLVIHGNENCTSFLPKKAIDMATQLLNCKTSYSPTQRTLSTSHYNHHHHHIFFCTVIVEEIISPGLLLWIFLTSLFIYLTLLKYSSNIFTIEYDN